MSKSGKFSILINILIGLFGFILLALYLNSEKVLPSISDYIEDSAPKKVFLPVIAPKGTIQAIVATSSADLEKGLSGILSLAEDRGMLFVFTIDGPKSFWMKDMFFPIDIIWLNKDKKVVGILPNLGPETYPNIFVSPDGVRYVLELNAGQAEKYGIATGTLLTFMM